MTYIATWRDIMSLSKERRIRMLDDTMSTRCLYRPVGIDAQLTILQVQLPKLPTVLRQRGHADVRDARARFQTQLAQMFAFLGECAQPVVGDVTLADV